MDESTILLLTDEIKGAISLGNYISYATPHVRRLVKIFSKYERVELLKYALRFYKTIVPGTYGLDKLIAFALSDSSHPLNDDRLPDEKHIDLISSSPSRIKLDKLNSDTVRWIRNISDGEDANGVAKVLCSTILLSPEVAGEELLTAFKSCIERPINSPELAAAISQCLHHNARLCEYYKVEARAIADDALMISAEDFRDVQNDIIDSVERPGIEKKLIFNALDSIESIYDPRLFHGLAQELADISAGPALSSLQHLNDDIRNRLDLEQRFRLVETPYGIFVPLSLRQRFTTDFSAILKRTLADKATLLALSPRRFEEFMGDLFQAMGYEVELTAATRDGGVDIICLKTLDGIPLRFAVELKRYKEDRPISVQMVRSFVGANQQFLADRLVFVTTSSYTAPAIDYAEKYAKRILLLKDYDQIKEWCQDVGKEKWRLIR